MRIEWTETKSRRNKALRGKGFEEAVMLFAGNHQTMRSVHEGERRWEVWGWLDGKPWLAVFAFNYDGSLRVVSLRRANKRERKKHYGIA